MFHMIFCKECNRDTIHDFQFSINEDVKTTIEVCKECGEALVDVGPIDNCDICEHHECFDCPVVA